MLHFELPFRNIIIVVLENSPKLIHSFDLLLLTGFVFSSNSLILIIGIIFRREKEQSEKKRQKP